MTGWRGIAIESGEAPAVCPSCGGSGRRVGEVTLKALLRPAALARLAAPAHRFCPAPACPVVYFGTAESFGRDDLSVPVFQKEPEGDRIVCYCFAVGEQELRDRERGSAAAERIRELVKAGRCACEVRHPQGSCCLGNVAAMATPPPGRPAAAAGGRGPGSAHGRGGGGREPRRAG